MPEIKSNKHIVLFTLGGIALLGLGFAAGFLAKTIQPVPCELTVKNEAGQQVISVDVAGTKELSQQIDKHIETAARAASGVINAVKDTNIKITIE
ncbi:MAG: hypothetical protein LBJ18_00930 [Rickettsiales bacterium]|jgi:hypothetical protein|nr:hypothetical protein [Rickettsiales bacterium]